MATLNELLADPQTAGTWRLVADRSAVTVRATSMWGLLPVKGRFRDLSGEGRIAPDGSVSGRAVVPAATLRTGISKRDEHLRSEDFFAVERYPDITLAVTGLRPAGGSYAEIAADLTVRDVTRPVTLAADVDRQSDGSVRITASTAFDRHDFSVSGNLVGMIGPGVRVAAEVVFVRA